MERISPETANYFMHYKWPGNVRELQNMIEMLVVMKEKGEIDVDDLPPKFRNIQSAMETTTGIQITEEGINFNDRVS